MWNEAKALRGLTLMSEALALLDDMGEGTLAAQLSFVVERLREKLGLNDTAVRPAD